ncbi:MAG: adenosylmethionine--8-amino-7-oxononanoate transaminase [Verrucomicrobia bacterium Tous-C9LFEB]|nr:MAG: adenosylmethionine--8-amino-7-oxononanoate transaminase [Verrucomicrobia bacterium Tous-C9LFEB]
MNSVDLDRAHVWHPFTPTDAWFDPHFKPVMIASARGSVLLDEEGNAYLDGNSSIWTNMHGHNHPVINQAIKDQLDRVAHTSYLGLGHGPGSLLGEKLTALVGPDKYRVFYSDDGATAIEAAIKITLQHFDQINQPQRRLFVSLGNGYHGDTVGAMSVGHSSFHTGHFNSLMFPSVEVMQPGCYRCPCNRATPERADARTYRQCEWQCLAALEKVFQERGPEIAALVLEPRVQGAAGMVMHPAGYLAKAAQIAKDAGAMLILDEVMTGFGRTGEMFAADHEGVKADLIALAKGLTGGYLPLGATLIREEIFQSYRGPIERTFYHGHSYCGNQLGCAAALANLELFDTEHTLDKIRDRAAQLKSLSQIFWQHPHVGDIRQDGFILGIELVEDFATRKPFPFERRIAYHVSERAKQYGLLARGAGNVLILMPPYSTTKEQLEKMVEALYRGLCEELPA